ncbi:MAG: Threonine synthase [Alphaproteobacteria bacterium MarineAlpha5_Bin11]|nr:MAG: Threonine synthase [Alphaproteobacteria bacterium MarineAlpha5_Bin11]PPR52202.1 MAG: Threonine synthase [Alphaproteobacteria bacterium MarineAlpha5_Bin10]|tara:strand:+ start:2403 stop:3782 length:1380 start_codon:yes stop_codon:yes gene_type:complete
MKYNSTRNSSVEKNFREIVMQGLSSEGGLFMPTDWPKVNVNSLKGMQYFEVAFEIISQYCNDSIPDEELRNLLKKTYDNFHHPQTAPLLEIEYKKYILELFYGPTFAFKDYALQFVGNLFEHLLEKENKNITIIGATSGDTGSAAISACKLKSNINLFILHPHGRISDVQRMQMTTAAETNIHNIAIKGNFDDCQQIVKKLFSDHELLKKTNISAANSINWARIIAQSAYYYWAFLQMHQDYDKIEFIVPSGNFGNAYAANVAAKMGLPVEKLYIVTNSNDILHSAISNGKMEVQEVLTTLTPSMDIQISSNFERQLFESMQYDSNNLVALMDSFSKTGNYTLSEKIVEDLEKKYRSFSVNDETTLETIRLFDKKYNYIADPHTATGLSIIEKLKEPSNPLVSLACAHPAKFADTIKKATGKDVDYPDSLKKIFEKEEKFNILDNDYESVKTFIIDNLN